MVKLQIIKKTKMKCKFCGLHENDAFRYGLMYKLGEIVAHYYCVLLSSKLDQKGKDDEGMLGFLYTDIKNELKRTADILCFYCKKGNATIGCASRSCRRQFHLPCGLKNGSLNQFIGNFKSFCHLHCPKQNIPEHILKEACNTDLTCCICYERHDATINKAIKKRKILWAPCCLKAWYHLHCVQKLACSAGYFFRCPTCNDFKKFNKWVQEFGVFIPQQDASWELVPNAFEDLLMRYNNCDAEVCLCPHGRKGNGEKEMWEIVLCDSCGSQGIHVACGRLKYPDSEWECSDCRKVTKRIKCRKKIDREYKADEDEGSSGVVKFDEICQKKRRRDSEDLENLVLDKRKKYRQEVQEEEIEIDVETVDGETNHDPAKRVIGDQRDTCDIVVENEEDLEATKSDQEVIRLLKPGPLSYKLNLIRKYLKSSKSQPSPSVEENRGIVSAKPSTVVMLPGSEDENGGDRASDQVGKRAPEIRVTPISPRKLTPDLSSLEKETLSSDPALNQQGPSFSLSNFDVLALMTFHSSGGQGNDEEPQTAVYGEVTVNTAGVERHEKYFSVYALTHHSDEGQRCWSTGKEAFTQNLKLNETNKEKQEGFVQVFDDDVVILAE